MKRLSGVLLHISSLPGKYGIGRFGQAAYDFVDFLKETGQTYWQILPLTTTSYGDSPYQSFSAFAGNTNFIDLDQLINEGWLSEEDLAGVSFGDDPKNVDYGVLFRSQRIVLEKAVARFIGGRAHQTSEFKRFLDEQRHWLEAFAEYMTVKEHHQLAPYYQWPDEFRFYDKGRIASFVSSHEKSYRYHLVTQYWFFDQWHDLKAYANEQGIQIIGDLPIYIARDSVEMWTQPHLFHTDDQGDPVTVAGTPPDDFSSQGQYWGNPIYHWNNMGENDYQWWSQRLEANFKLYDIVRIDHFRGFEAYWEIPYGAEHAKDGHWTKGPGIHFFDRMQSRLGKLPIIAEDLGYITDDVRNLLEWTGYPGMKVLQFAFDGESDSDYLPHHHTTHSIAYVGTHDNHTALGYYQSAVPNVRRQVDRYLNRKDDESPALALNRGIAASPSQIAIYMMQDLLHLDDSARMNVPSTIGDNWRWRMTSDAVTPQVRQELYDLTKIYFRMRDDA